ncbi:hypothetical protein HBN50_06105 [Halobacteriovorax sp. GB3]|uniref:hypothetical protein n=1 Tax=Halobacteriovorax sp. GB3 TaxID=2719615 RepID=UPI00236220EB|nr:hypothetical protein [Halobacteriovorax sp. GB3]MDD0852660.1 hypothetical protein [Halobacteriovorax sp. GB3]
MKLQLKNILISQFITLLILIVLEIVSTGILPLLGLQKYTIPFNILIVLFMGFKLETPYIAVLIFLVQYFHSFFSIEGWEMGTIAGVIICIVISYVRDLIHFHSAAATMFVTQVFQVVWFVIVSGLLYLKLDNMDYLVEKFWRFLPESILISLMAPFFFSLLDKIWGVQERGLLGDES